LGVDGGCQRHNASGAAIAKRPRRDAPKAFEEQTRQAEFDSDRVEA
jgi:hypothetical protein